MRNMFWTHIHPVFLDDQERQNKTVRIAKRITRIVESERQQPGPSAYSWAEIPHNFVSWRVAVCLAMMHAYCLNDLPWIQSNWAVSPIMLLRWPQLSLSHLYTIVFEDQDTGDLTRLLQRVLRCERLLATYLRRILQPGSLMLRDIAADPAFGE